MNCPKCNAENLDTNEFCNTCGFKLGVTSIECIKCHQYNSIDNSFCGICGSPIEPSSLGSIIAADVSTGIETEQLPMVNFVEAIKGGFNKYLVFKGRATRAEFWWWAAFAYGGMLILGIFNRYMSFDVALGTSLLSSIFLLLILVPTISVTSRRLHDINKTGWWQLLYLILFIVPTVLRRMGFELGGAAIILIGLIIVILVILGLHKQGDKDPNKYGPDPSQSVEVVD